MRILILSKLPSKIRRHLRKIGISKMYSWLLLNQNNSPYIHHRQQCYSIPKRVGKGLGWYCWQFRNIRNHWLWEDLGLLHSYGPKYHLLILTKVAFRQIQELRILIVDLMAFKGLKRSRLWGLREWRVRFSFCFFMFFIIYL